MTAGDKCEAEVSVPPRTWSSGRFMNGETANFNKLLEASVTTAPSLLGCQWLLQLNSA